MIGKWLERIVVIAIIVLVALPFCCTPSCTPHGTPTDQIIQNDQHVAALAERIKAEKQQVQP